MTETATNRAIYEIRDSRLQIIGIMNTLIEELHTQNETLQMMVKEEKYR